MASLAVKMIKHCLHGSITRLLIIAMVAPYSINAQARPSFKNKYNHSLKGRRESPGYYWTIYGSYGGLLSNNPNMNLTLSFPYQSSANGNATQTFLSQRPNSAPRNFFVFDVLNFSIGLKKAFVDIGMGGITKLGPVSNNFEGGMRFNTGAGINIPLVYPSQSRKSLFYLKASINTHYSYFNINEGSINNLYTTITVLGLTAAPSFTYVTGSKYNRHTVSTNAQELQVQLRENYWVLAPKISFGANPTRQIFYWSIDLAYYIPYYHKEKMIFTQFNGQSGYNQLKKVDLSSRDILLTNNLVPVKTLPYNFKNLYFGFTVGISMSQFN